MTPLVGTRGGDRGWEPGTLAPPPATGAKYRERVRRGASRPRWQPHGQYEGGSPLGLYYSVFTAWLLQSSVWRGKELIVYLWINWKHQHADWATNWLGLCWTICTSSSSSEPVSRPRDSSAALFCLFVFTFAGLVSGDWGWGDDESVTPSSHHPATCMAGYGGHWEEARGVSHWPAGGRVVMQTGQTGDVTKKVHTSRWVMVGSIIFLCIV